MSIVLPRSTTSYHVIPADPGRDAAEIVSFWSRNFPELTPEQHRLRFEWNYCSGPYGPGRCWLLTAGEDIVGTAGLGMRRLEISGATFAAGLASDLAVDARHRSLQPALMLQRQVLEALRGGDVSLVYGLPNSKSIGVFRRLGYSSVAKIRRFVKVLRVDPYLEQRNAPVIAQKLVSAPANLGMRMVSPETWRKSQAHVIRELAAFDNRFDELFSRTHASVALTTARSAAFLKWRYTDCPLRKYRTVGLLTPDESRLSGYAVLYSTGGHWFVADVWNEPCRDIACDLLGGVICWAREQQAVSIQVETAGCDELENTLCRFGFRIREEGRMELMAMTSEEERELATMVGRWYFLSGDEDYN
jgi:hypothetical protein